MQFVPEEFQKDEGSEKEQRNDTPKSNMAGEKSDRDVDNDGKGQKNVSWNSVIIIDLPCKWHSTWPYWVNLNWQCTIKCCTIFLTFLLL